MRTFEERTQELHRRMDSLQRKKQHRRYILTCAAALIVCLAIVILIAFGISRIGIQTTDINTGSAAASIFADQASLGYVVVALLAFCLGALVTVFCFRIKKHMKENQDDDRAD